MTHARELYFETESPPSCWFDEWSEPLTLDDAEAMCRDCPALATRIHTTGWDGTHGMTLQEYHNRRGETKIAAAH